MNNSGEFDPRDIDPRDDDSRYESQQRQRTPRPSPDSKINLGAFFILDHVVMAMDLNFADALGDFILSNGSDNKAILAFGHRLKKLTE